MSLAELPFQFLGIRQVCAAVGFGRSHVYKLVSKGEFPPPLKVGSTNRWRSDVIAEWLEETAKAAEAV